jgi:hypothetical protein
VVWSFLVLSARLSHLWRVQQEQLGVKPATLFSIGALAVLTRLIGNTLAILNALWVITFSILQFTNVYNNCWCASSALQWGANHYILLFPQPSQIYAIASPFWIAGTFIGIASAAICVIFFMLAKGDDLFRMDAQ